MNTLKNNSVIKKKFIGEGSYGCVYYPHIECNDGKSYKNTIGKIFNNKNEADNEYYMYNKIMKLDPKSIFTLKLHGKCEVDISKRNNDLNTCNKFNFLHKLTINNFTQLIYDYGGPDLFNFKEKLESNSLDLILISLLELLNGLIILNKNNIVHADIRDDNIHNQMNLHR